MRYSTKFSRAQSGAALLITLWILVIMTLVIGWVGQTSRQAIEELLSVQTRQQAEFAMADTLATVQYLLITRPTNLHGLLIDFSPDQLDPNIDPLSYMAQPAFQGRVLLLDDQPYFGTQGARFSIQDSGGLVGLNSLSNQRFSQLLGVLGVPIQERGILLDRLLDYTDFDDLVRLNGAERDDYLRAGRLPPPNRPLLSPWELQNILGFEQFPELFTEHRLPRLTTALSGHALNLNTSPAEILQLQPEIDAHHAETIVAARPLRSLGEASQIVGRPINLEITEVAYAPTQTFRITIFHPDTPLAREVLLTLTPSSRLPFPWMAEYDFNLERPRITRDPRDPKSLFDDPS